MLRIDYRAGSKDLVKPLQKLLGEENVYMTSSPKEMPDGDVAFEGLGIGGDPVRIGVEFKKLGEMITCCRDGRFAGDQLPGLTGPKKIYDYAWLLIESPSGGWRANDAGFVSTYQGPRRGWVPVPGRMRASEFEKHLLTFAVCGGVYVQHTDSRDATCRFLVNLYRWWTDVALDAHTSHLAVHTPSLLGEVSGFREAVMKWPGIGLKVSRDVEEMFNGSIRQACQAQTEEWAEITTNGRRLGFPTAQRIDRFLSGDGEEA